MVARRLAENAEVSVLRPKADGSDDIIQPDDHLVEANLCKSLGVSRTSLREALRSLQAKRRQAIEQRQHDRRIGHRQWMNCSRSRASTFSLSARASISEWRAEPVPPLAHFRLTTLNPNLFGSPTRSDYCFLARSDRDAGWQRRDIFGIRNLNLVRRCAGHLGRGINLSEAE